MYNKAHVDENSLYFIPFTVQYSRLTHVLVFLSLNLTLGTTFMYICFFISRQLIIFFFNLWHFEYFPFPDGRVVIKFLTLVFLTIQNGCSNE